MSEETTHEWLQVLEQSKGEAYLKVVQSQAFLAAFPHAMTAEQFVDKLFLEFGKVPTPAERAQLIAALGSGSVAGRAAALRVVEQAGGREARAGDDL